MLKLSSHLPEVHFASGDVVVREGGTGCGLWLLVSGALRVRKGGVPVNTISSPGALIGEISVWLGSAYGATVEATEPSVLRLATDGQALLASDSAIARFDVQN